jgi:hypothetical protein
MRALLLAAAALAAVPAAAQEAAPAAVEDELKINQLIIYGDDRCPESTNEEVVICAKRPERDRFRIPEPLRNFNDPRNESWVNTATELQYVGRSGIGSCSPSGPGGGIGCLTQLINTARAERAGRQDVNWNALIEEARQERLSKIDAQAAAEEEEAKEREEAQSPR